MAHNTVATFEERLPHSIFHAFSALMNSVWIGFVLVVGIVNDIQ